MWRCQWLQSLGSTQLLLPAPWDSTAQAQLHGRQRLTEQDTPASLGWDEAGLQPRLCVFSLLQLSPSRPPELHRGPSQRAPALQGQASGSCLPGCGQFSWMRLPPSFGASGTPPAFSLQTGPASGPGCLGFPRKRPPVPTPQCWGLSSMCGSLMLDRDGSEQHGL